MRATQKLPKICFRWCTRNCAAWLRTKWPTKFPAKPSNPPHWSMKSGCGFRSSRGPNGRTGGSSSQPRPKSCGAFWWTARRRRAKKHGGDLERVDMDAVELPIEGNDGLVLQVHEALEQLAAEDPEKAQVVKLRFFVGLENAEVATLLGVSEKTVQRHWAFAKAWLTRAMQEDA